MQQPFNKTNHLPSIVQMRRQHFTEGYNARIGDLLEEETFQPECLRLRVYLDGEGIAAKACGHRTKIFFPRTRAN